ncbi:glycosyl hydrolase 115 family protein [Sphingomonas sp. 4RDLI-65]|uniref:glycosyl hydrolase 115 family protein n=1 Tax=Sphingomonas sp. 4RDLI-65 TaxID=3111641 RepID=UPI003C1FD98A
MFAAALWLGAPASAEPVARLVAFEPGAGLPLADAQGIARVVTAPGDHAVVRIAAADLTNDLRRVTGATTANGTQIWLGTLGRSAAIDRLVRRGTLDVSKLRGAWESFVIATVANPTPGVAAALVIVGSDRRGTAFGAYELSRAIGVSPWHWWADVTPEHHAAIYAPAGLHRFGPPSVQYRGIFLNDEDWGLQPWAAETFEPDAGTIGPKTYAKLFELMLRLKANLVWPAMHKVTAPFNANPENAQLADRYAIVMGSSHAEPMLRNNVGEWSAPAADFNYLTNPAGVADYWKARVRANGRYESVWTLGMRGIHDSGIVGPTTDDARRSLLERVFADQRAMLANGVNRNFTRVPQVFTPYKEVLDVYRGGLKVPDDVTLMWPDDNFGYIRHVPDAAERARSGGAGIYYHLSYLGAPLSYLWLSTTPPALIREELGRAWDAGARRMWVANVGDLKPAELATDYFMQLAWDVPGVRAKPIDTVVTDWAGGTIGADVAPEIAAIMAEHHRLNFQRRSEHLQWWLPGEVPKPSPLTPSEVSTRLTAFDALRTRVRSIAPRIAPHRRDAFFELVDYPVTAAALANTRVFDAEMHDRLRDTDADSAAVAGERSRAADAEITARTIRYNNEIAGGKWRGMMAVEPADGQWRRYRLSPPILPAPATPPRRRPGPRWNAPGEIASPFVTSAVPTGPRPSPGNRAVLHASTIVIEAETSESPRNGWRVIDGLGRNGVAIAAAAPATLSYTVTLPAGRWQLAAEVLPTYPTNEGADLAVSVAIDGGKPVRVGVPRKTGDRAWALAVLDNRLHLALPTPLSAGPHTVSIGIDDPAILFDALRFDPLSDPAPSSATAGTQGLSHGH